MQYETQFLGALLLTVTVEATTIFLANRSIPFIRSVKLTLPQLIGTGSIPSIATLPYFWLVLPAYITEYLPRMLAGEGGIFVVETVLILLITRLPLRYCALLSFITNGASIVAGLILFR